MFVDVREEMKKIELDISVDEALENPEQPEAKKLRISQDIERIWLGEYRQFYEE